MSPKNNKTNSLSEKHKNRMIQLSLIISVLQIIGMLLEYSKVFMLYPLPQKFMQASILAIILISFVVLLTNKNKFYKMNFLILSYFTICSIVFSFLLFPEFYININTSRDLFFMRNMLFLYAYIGFVGLIAGRRHIWIQGSLAILYMTFVFIVSDNKFMQNSLPIYYLATLGFCWVMSNTVKSLDSYLHELSLSNNLNEKLHADSIIKSNRLELYSKSIVDLSNIKNEKSENKINETTTYNHIVKTISKTLNISRASIWLFSDDKKSIVKKVLIDDDKFDTTIMKLHEKDFPNYFSGVLKMPYILANEAATHQCTKEFNEVYLKPLNIYSMLDCPIKLNTEVVGIVCCENKNEIREWNQEDLLYVQSISDYIALYLKNSQIETLFLKLEEKNTEILDSIKYARRLQSAILPSPKLVEKYLVNSFVLYKPKDIVAGDFYWMEASGENILFAVADCTGHGVPGAMISVVCHNALNRAVKEYNLLDPGQILNKTREIVIEQFEKSEENINDGMDISLCVYNLKDNLLKWSGANSPLLIRNSSGIKKLLPTKQPIGKYPNPKPFITMNTEIQKGDLIYLYTDGYIDQFGGKNDKKMKQKRFTDLVNEFYYKELSEQKILFNNAFEEWKGRREQIDDVCIIGVRF